jgi:3-oxoacyl-[acyl-carrier protein] reductase
VSDRIPDGKSGGTSHIHAAPDIRLDGRVALVTGAGAGIGRAIALTYARLGACVVAVEIDANRCTSMHSALEEIGPGHVVINADVRRSADASRVFELMSSTLGRLDILVNNVGDNLRLRGTFESFSEDDWDDLYAINLRHVFLYTRGALPLIRRTGAGGSIINLSTIEAYRGAPPAAVYAAFKAAITGFTKSIALELAPEHIRVNIIAPETTETEQVPVSRMIAEQHREHTARWIPMGRFGTPEDVAGCAVFLATELSAWVTGTTLHVDGGALAAGGFYRAADGRWTNFPVVTDVGVNWRPPLPPELSPRRG